MAKKKKKIKKSALQPVAKTTPPQTPKELNKPKQEEIQADRERLPLPVPCKIPSPWHVDMSGVWHLYQNESVYACRTPVILTKRFVREHDDEREEWLELSFYRDNKWNPLLVSRETIAAPALLVKLAKRGLGVTDDLKKACSRYLAHFERTNIDVLPVIQFTHRLGWFAEKEFFPGASSKTLQPWATSREYTTALQPLGSLSAWREIVQDLRRYSLPRFILSVGFAAPLVEVCKMRTAFIHLWGASTSGKTAGLKAAMSVWADPSVLMRSFNATEAGLVVHAEFLRHLPIVLDELQIVGKETKALAKLVYLLSEGQGRTKSTAHHKVLPGTNWQTTVLSSGEQPLTTEDSYQGMVTRVLEIGMTQFIPDVALAGQIHAQIDQCYGTAGPAFAAKMVHEQESIRKAFEAYTAVIAAIAPTVSPPHRTILALVATADLFSGMWVFEESEESAILSTHEMIESVCQFVAASERDHESIREVEAVSSWIEKNSERFLPEPRNGQEWGWIDIHTGTVMAYADELKKAIRAAGLHSDKVLATLQSQQLLHSYLDESTGSVNIKKKLRNPHNQTQRWVYTLHFPGVGHSQD